MKKIYDSILHIRFMLLLTLGLSFNGNAQYYTIQDASFATWLNNHFPSCMSGNQLDTTCSLMLSLTQLEIYGSSVTSIDGVRFFDNLDILTVRFTSVTSLPDLPNAITFLNCSNNNQLNSITDLPESLTEINSQESALIALPYLPANLSSLNCSANQLTTLPDLPSNLSFLNCNYNQLIALPVLPSGLTQLLCDSNPLYVLPDLPEGLIGISCMDDQLSSLPSLPASLTGINCAFNNITCFDDTLSMQIVGGSIVNNPCTCVPNHNAITGGLPLCYQNDPWNNPYECFSTIHSGIAGKIFVNQNNDCIIDLSEPVVPNIPIHLYSDLGAFLALTYTDNWGNYYFPNDNANYRIALDTQSYSTSCSVDTLVSIQNTVVDSVDLILDCSLSPDLGISSIVNVGLVSPGQTHNLLVFAGNMLSNYPLSCLDSIGGTLTFTVNGPAEFISVPLWSLPPTQINGNTFSYDIANFSEIGYYQSFGVELIVDTTAQTNDLICVTASISIQSTDPDTLNNTLQWCYQVSNSYDPNKKDVYPFLVEPDYNDYLTYTIHFQNTGTAPAINIRLTDLLDANLVPETFELIRSSDPVIPMLTSHSLSFLFKDIMLPDSTNNEPESHGFVQYRIKPVSGLPAGTIIPNTASIYFDYNSPIVTNTATTTFSALSVNQVEANTPLIYPNPSTGLYHVKFTESIEEINVFNLTGERILQQQNLQNNAVIDLGNQPAGVYLLRMNHADQANYVRLVKL